MSGYQFIGTLVFTLFVHASFAQEANEESTTEVEVKQNIERIQVTGRKPRRFFLKEYEKHQKAFFESFNELVEDRDMQVVCEATNYTRTRIKKRNCQPRFIETIKSEETQREISRNGGGERDIAGLQRAANVIERPEVQQRIIKEFKNFQKLTAKLLNKHPELASTYTEMQDALAKYENYNKD